MNLLFVFVLVLKERGETLYPQGVSMDLFCVAPPCPVGVNFSVSNQYTQRVLTLQVSSMDMNNKLFQSGEFTPEGCPGFYR